MKNPFRMGCVYAGPDLMNRRPRAEEKAKEFDMKDVYAGPEEMSKMPNEYDIMAIYAGPMEIEEDLTEDEKEAEDAPYPMNHAEQETMISGVYAAPNSPIFGDAFSKFEENEPRMALVYAGPVVKSEEVSFEGMGMGMSNPSPEMPKESKFCANCGSKFLENAKFCSVCGTKRGILV